MLKHFFLWICLGLSSALIAEPQSPSPEQDENYVPFNVSLFGPMSFQNGSYRKRDNYFCLGILHCGSRDLNGLGLSLVSNTSSRDLNGAAIALGGNMVDGNGKGLMASFLFNWNGGDFYGFQLSSLNMIGGDEFHGVQFALLSNYAPARTSGIQWSFLNLITAAETDQIASNSADTAKKQEGETTREDEPFAVQLGFINYSEQARTIPIGIFNFVRGGRFDLGVSTSVFGYNRVDLAMGSEYFYSLLGFVSTGLNPSKAATFHPRANGKNYLGFGLAIPLVGLPHTFAKIEYFSSYAPTNFEVDDGILRRYLLEYQFNPYLKISGGIESFSFDNAHHSQALRSQKSGMDITLGASFNLLGWWR